MNKVLILLAALTASAQAGEKKTLNLGLVPKSQQVAPVQVSDPPQKRGDPNDPNVRVFPGGGAEDLLKVTKRLDDDVDNSIREGNQNQTIEPQRLKNRLPDGPAAAARDTTPLNAQGR